MPNRPPSHRPPRPATVADPRPSAAKRGYGRQWRKVSKARLSGEPCADCLERGEVNPATQLHHLTRHKGDPAGVFDLDNTRPLCHSCHSIRTARGE